MQGCLGCYGAGILVLVKVLLRCCKDSMRAREGFQVQCRAFCFRRVVSRFEAHYKCLSS